MLIAPRFSSRRWFLERMGAGFGAVAFHALGQLSAQGSSRASTWIDPLNPARRREPQFRPQAKSVIFLFMVGGPSHVDTFDYKPELQKLNGKAVPDSIRRAVSATRHARWQMPDDRWQMTDGRGRWQMTDEQMTDDR